MKPFDPNDIDPIGAMMRQVKSPSDLSEVLYTLAEMHQEGDFPFSNWDMPSFLRGLGTAALSFEEPKGRFEEIAKEGQWRVFAEIIDMALELD